MDDLISREEVKKTLKMLAPGLKWSAIDWMVDGIPSAQQEQRWIPVSERLPQYDGEKYFVTYYDETIRRTRIGISYCYVNREGFWSDVPLGYKVIAWMPLPKPYEGEES